MKVKLIDFGYSYPPKRAHDNDCGADVYATSDCIIKGHTTVSMPLGFGLEVPDGYAAYVFPRSGLSAQGVVCELPPVDSGYRGEIHAIISNLSDKEYHVEVGDRVGQLVIMPIVIADFVESRGKERGTGAFASTGK